MEEFIFLSDEELKKINESKTITLLRNDDLMNNTSFFHCEELTMLEFFMNIKLKTQFVMNKIFNLVVKIFHDFLDHTCFTAAHWRILDHAVALFSCNVRNRTTNLFTFSNKLLNNYANFRLSNEQAIYFLHYLLVFQPQIIQHVEYLFVKLIEVELHSNMLKEWLIAFGNTVQCERDNEALMLTNCLRKRSADRVYSMFLLIARETGFILCWGGKLHNFR